MTPLTLFDVEPQRDSSPEGVCSVPDCGRPIECKALCTKHYLRLRRNGTTFLSRTNLTRLQRWATKVVLPADREGCWGWTGGVNWLGYAQFSFLPSRHGAAHRFGYETFVGPIPEGMQLDHLCRNRGCVNPGHVEPVTNRENVLRGVGITARRARQTHCVRGHLLEGDNLYRTSDGHRRCRLCGEIRGAARYKSHRAGSKP